MQEKEKRMKRFAIVIPYFGQFKPSIVLFLESCNRNKDIDWFIITDCQIPNEVILNSNINWIRMTLEEARCLAEIKLECKVELKRAYKLCDLKPFYGLIFEDYLVGYEYWGFGDTDVIYGRLSEFLFKINYSNYEKINWMGHLCFVRNTQKCNRAVFVDGKGTLKASEVLQNENNVGFDERDYNRKCLKNEMKIYNGKWSADIDIFYWRMRCVDVKTYHYLLDTFEIKDAPRNYSKQMFAVIKGRICRIYLKFGRVHVEEFAYIHFRKEVPIKFENYEAQTYLITREGFELILNLENKLHDYQYVLKLIKKYNNQENFVQEVQCFISQFYRKITGKRGW